MSLPLLNMSSVERALENFLVLTVGALYLGIFGYSLSKIDLRVLFTVK
jgi:hypothetical protein